MGRPLDARELHHALAGRWPDILVTLGIDREHLRNRHGPCPVCGGKDRFRFDDKNGRGTWICTHCGAGDGFKLLQLAFGWDFPRTCREVAQAAGLLPHGAADPVRAFFPERSNGETRDKAAAPASPTARVRSLRRSAAAPGDVPDVAAYLQSRHLWPLSTGCALRAHAAAPYYDGPELIGKYPALLADVVDLEGEVVTAHVTYVPGGRKLQGHAPRKILSPMTGRRGCAVRLMPCDGDVLGVAEGIETALAAARIHGVPTWAALNAGMLGRFVPPPEVHHVLIFADADRAGFEAAWKLAGELDGRATTELRLPPTPAKDWAEVLEARS